MQVCTRAGLSRTFVAAMMVMALATDLEAREFRAADTQSEDYPTVEALRYMGHLQGMVPALRETFAQMHRDSAEGWRDIARRLATIGEPLAGWQACLQAGMDQGLWAAVPSRTPAGRRQAQMVKAFDEIPRDADRVIFFPRAAGGA